MQQQRREVERNEEDERARQQQPRRRGSENHSTDAEHVDNVDKFWGKVQHTQQVNFHAEEVDENNIFNTEWLCMKCKYEKISPVTLHFNEHFLFDNQCLKVGLMISSDITVSEKKYLKMLIHY